ncbi:MAG TPA: HD domain-containing phosphohydrolase [Blastocatellia bacterium]|nr:HD domain-containing phosphohydrolase [Blastocatellia bacterium]HMY71533.1 HD domain-containing phosphohydrolase [Blastocatellia bacterium]HMZ16444.1 HD domain-containing phosphohydrolase [Blastocatellia bacterium]HNG30571.1 HD domain-containing phosphohydrolase [Blastocatellia bacterium]
MQPQQAPLIFTDAERRTGDSLLKLALETDRAEGYTEPHAVMIARLAETLGAQMGLHGTDLSALKFAALAHDIGEREMKRNYLLQPNPLTWEQTLDLWRHPIIGEQAAAELNLPRQTQLLIRWHHEWWNGQGYPDGLTGTAIPLGARILRAVDTYCALISRRPHRGNYDLLDAEQILADQAGVELDPQIVKLLLALVVAERKQREAESWTPQPAQAIEFQPESEPQFELRRAAAEESLVAAHIAEAAEFEPEAPAHSPHADTLEMPVIVIAEQQAPEAAEPAAEENRFALEEATVSEVLETQPQQYASAEELPTQEPSANETNEIQSVVHAEPEPASTVNAAETEDNQPSTPATTNSGNSGD